MKTEPTLWLKFSGRDLDVRSVPIYELGETLIALQRIVHKTFLFENGRLRKRAQLTQEERAHLSLQISERKRSSDFYALIPFLADPTLQQHLADLLKIGLGTLAKYALQQVLPQDRKSRGNVTDVSAGDVDGSVLVGAIYAETVQITNHINNIGGIESIEIVPAARLNVPSIKITEDTQQYIRAIVNETYKGKMQEITGYVTRMLPNRLIAEIKLAPSHYVKIGMPEDAFTFVRYQTEPEQMLRFKGRPIYRLGKDSVAFQEFEAVSVDVDADEI